MGAKRRKLHSALSRFCPEGSDDLLVEDLFVQPAGADRLDQRAAGLEGSVVVAEEGLEGSVVVAGAGPTMISPLWLERAGMLECVVKLQRPAKGGEKRSLKSSPPS